VNPDATGAPKLLPGRMLAIAGLLAVASGALTVAL